MKPAVLFASALLFVGPWPTAVPSAFGQAQPAAAAPTPDGTLRYEVVEVTGNVRYAPVGTDPKQEAGWTKAQVGDLLGAGIQIHVPAIRAAVKLTARPSEPPTALLFERGTLLAITDLALDKTQGVARSRVKLAYGAIRAGVAEGATRSDMQIEAPVATLSKRGTDIFRFEYRDGQFMMSLSEQGRGLIQAIQTKATQFGGLDRMKSRFVTPGQFVTQQMMRAIDNVQFDRTVNINDNFGLQGLDQLFTMLNNHGGFAFLLPAGSNPVNVLGSSTGEGLAGAPPPLGQEATLATQQMLQSLFRTTVRNAAGDFGVGQSSVPGIFDTQKSKTSFEARRALSQTARTVKQSAEHTRQQTKCK